MIKYIRAAFKALINKQYRTRVLLERGYYKNCSDEDYLRIAYKAYVGRDLNIDEPKTFNEKLQWLKLYNRRPEYTVMVDKFLVRDYIAEKIGHEYLIPLLGVWDNPYEIDFSKLPDQFVLKCNHNSGLGMCICKNKEKLDKKTVIKKLQAGLRQDYFEFSREWPYKNVPRKIIAEKYMEDHDQINGLLDYKFMCFNGVVKCIFTCSDRFSKDGLKVTFYDTEWNIMPFTRHYPRQNTPEKKPKSFEKMVELAEKLAAGIPFVRIDFYEICGRIYFGEITFFPGSGFEEFSPEEWDKRLGSWIKLPAKEI